MPVKKLQRFLDEQGVKYVTINHSPAYTAREVAASTLVPRALFAKTVMIKVDGTMAMAVLPASRRVDLDRLSAELGAEHVEIASEQEFADAFPGCEVGAMPPFGNLYDMDVYVAEKLTEDDEIAFNAGSHTQIIQMGYRDYENLVKPKIVRFAVKH